jgi:hypothetical protein
MPEFRLDPGQVGDFISFLKSPEHSPRCRDCFADASQERAQLGGWWELRPFSGGTGFPRRPVQLEDTTL